MSDRAHVAPDRQVLIIYTGGTLGMEPSPTGLRPARNFAALLDAVMPEARNDDMPDFDVLELGEPIDSADCRPADWLRIAAAINDHRDAYDGFVVIHGTDSMAFTGAALSFLLAGLNKPVVVTGAQMPLRFTRNDARRNLLKALAYASVAEIRETCLVFADKLLRANRTAKADANRFTAFASPNFPELGEAGIALALRRDLLLGAETALTPLIAPSHPTPRIVTARLFPGLEMAVLSGLLDLGPDALILETYGAGNGPAGDPSFLAVLARAQELGCLVLNVTQCAAGAVDMDNYATGAALRDRGVASAHDMTFEAALAKLYYLFWCHGDAAAVRARIETPLCGELTRR